MRVGGGGATGFAEAQEVASKHWICAGFRPRGQELVRSEPRISEQTQNRRHPPQLLPYQRCIGAKEGRQRLLLGGFWIPAQNSRGTPPAGSRCHSWARASDTSLGRRGAARAEKVPPLSPPESPGLETQCTPGWELGTDRGRLGGWGCREIILSNAAASGLWAPPSFL